MQRSLPAVALSVLSLLVLAAFSQAPGPLGPAEGPLQGPASFPEDVLDAVGSCASLEVGTGVRDIIPGFMDLAGNWQLWAEPYVDENGNGVYDAPNPLAPDEPFDPFTDENANGKWDGPYMAGYGHRKSGNEYYTAYTVHDPVWARALALRCGDLLLGLVSLDTVGLFQNEVWDVRARVASAGFDHVVVASTHTHDSVDTMGLWGPNELTDGKDPRTIEHFKEQAAAALLDAAGSLEPVTVTPGARHTQEPGIVEWAGYVQTDLRDPFVIDDLVLAARFAGLDGTTVGTLVNWSPHPETLAGTKSEISSDFADQLRRSVAEEGATVGGFTMPGLGGTAVYFSGAVGGMMTTLGARVYDETGALVADHSYAKADRIGEVAAWAALKGISEGTPSTVDGLRVQVREVTFPIDNVFLAALNTVGIFDHPVALGPATIGALPAPPGVVPPIPFIRTEVDVVTLSSGGSPLLQIVTVPGELLPEVAIGGHLASAPDATWESCYAYNPLKFDVVGGRHTQWNPAANAKQPGWERVVAAHSSVPAEEPIRDHMKASYQFLFGLANDELGYVVPANDFIAATPLWLDGPYLEGKDRCGDDDHYEETVSASSIMAPVIANNLNHMLEDGDYEAPAWPDAPAGILGDPGNVGGILYGEPVGVWLDTSGSGGYEEEEDVHVSASLPSWVSGAWGFLDGDARDQGQEPDEGTRGIWIDLNGNEEYDPADGVVFADHWALGE